MKVSKIYSIIEEGKKDDIDVVRDFILEQFGRGRIGGDSYQHYSYCSAPFEDCTCKNLDDMTYDTSLIRGGYIDSFSMVVVLMFLEKTFGVKVPDKMAIPDNFDTVSKMMELVNKIKNK